jgi:hypothetical protein
MQKVRKTVAELEAIVRAEAVGVIGPIRRFSIRSCCLAAKLITLRDAAEYITELPKAEHDTPQWQAAMQVLLLAAEHDGPAMFARVGVMKALNRHVERTSNADHKDTHWGKRKLRDQ